MPIVVPVVTVSRKFQDQGWNGSGDTLVGLLKYSGVHPTIRTMEEGVAGVVLVLEVRRKGWWKTRIGASKILIDAYAHRKQNVHA